MFYYCFYFEEFERETKLLTDAQKYIYMRLEQIYLWHEKPIKLEELGLYLRPMRVKSKHNSHNIRVVLELYYDNSADGYRREKYDKMIARARKEKAAKSQPVQDAEPLTPEQIALQTAQQMLENEGQNSLIGNLRPNNLTSNNLKPNNLKPNNLKSNNPKPKKNKTKKSDPDDHQIDDQNPPTEYLAELANEPEPAPEQTDQNVTDWVWPYDAEDYKQVENNSQHAKNASSKAEQERKAKTSKLLEEIESAFEIFFNAGLRKENKRAAHLEFLKLTLLIDDKKEFAEFLADNISRRRYLDEFGFDCLHPSTYLRDFRWEDEVNFFYDEAERVEHERRGKEYSKLAEQGVALYIQSASKTNTRQHD